MRFAALALAIVLAATACAAGDPFASSARARVLIFVRTDCPITNRYAPELQRLSQEFSGRGAEFWLVYPDPAATAQSIDRHLAEYNFPGTVLRDPRHSLGKLAHATTAPEAAVFDSAGRLQYHGRIDDRWVNPGAARAAARTHDLEDAIAAVLTGRRPARAATPAVGCSLADIE
ncbi:MAG: redoxin domain-containing protein [Acidobacteriota bacterium]|nr:redoxin domain-containing protein [Acidobacteriota bacterium]